MKTCAWCKTRHFGLISYRYRFKNYCSKQCLAEEENRLRDEMKQMEERATAWRAWLCGGTFHLRPP